jgi:hypothetical protein
VAPGGAPGAQGCIPSGDSGVSLFDNKYFPHLRPGLGVSYTTKRSSDGRWLNFEEFEVEGLDLDAQEERHGSLWAQKRRSFALDYAPRLVEDFGSDPDARYRAAFRYAEGFRRYITDGSIPEDAGEEG